MLFRVEGNHRLPPTTLSPGDMVCVRICDSRGAGATSCMQGFVHNLGEDGSSISVALESRHGDPTFSKLFGKSVRIDRIQGLADTLTYEVPNEWSPYGYFWILYCIGIKIVDYNPKASYVALRCNLNSIRLLL